MKRRRMLLASASALAVAPWHALAAEANANPAAEPVVLTISGKISKPNSGDLAQFDMTALARLPQVSFVTKTPWYPGPRKFTGPLLRDVLAAVGATGNSLHAVALNDYSVDIPVQDALHHDVIVARLLDDQPMRVRDKGPLFIIYPFDSDSELRNAVYFTRSAWQLKAIAVQ